MNSIYFADEHRNLRAQVARFIDNEVRPNGAAWEAQGFVPRDVLTRMGELGLLGIRYPSSYGGSELGQVSTVILAEELGKSSFGGSSRPFSFTRTMPSLICASAGSPHISTYTGP